MQSVAGLESAEPCAKQVDLTKFDASIMVFRDSRYFVCPFYLYEVQSLGPWPPALKPPLGAVGRTK